MADCKASTARLSRVRSWMAGEGFDAFLVRSTSDIQWLCAFDGVFDSEQAHALLVGPDWAVLHTDSRYAEACEREAAGGPVSIDAQAQEHAAWCAGRLAEGARVGFDDLMSLREHKALEQSLGGHCQLASSADALLNLRAVKDASELSRLQAAQDITDAAFGHILGFIRPGLTERSVQLELDAFMMAQGADGLAFPTIVATGAHASSPHAQPGEDIIEPGDAVVMDFGARKLGYCSDMTRTVFVGEPEAQLRRAFNAIRRANEECQAMLAPGVVGGAVHEHAQQVLEQEGFGGLMGHGLGHGVGIDIHEQPVLSPRNAKPIPKGCVVTVEPGIYVPGSFGMRLEDCGCVGEAGFASFASSTHEMVIV